MHINLESLEELEPVCIDSVDGDTPLGRLKCERDFAEEYITVGKVLSICEASCFRVGIPIMHPTARVKELRAQFDGSLEQFLRLNLVTVSTNALQSYDDEIMNLPSDCEGIESLGVTVPTHLERFSFVYLFAFTAVCILSCLYMSWVFFLIALGAVDLVALYVIRDCASDEARVNSFHRLLSRELMRRHGRGPGMETGIRIGSVEVEPLSD